MRYEKEQKYWRKTKKSLPSIRCVSIPVETIGLSAGLPPVGLPGEAQRGETDGVEHASPSPRDSFGFAVRGSCHRGSLRSPSYLIEADIQLILSLAAFLSSFYVYSFLLSLISFALSTSTFLFRQRSS
jgi:hypothetical protein